MFKYTTKINTASKPAQSSLLGFFALLSILFAAGLSATPASATEEEGIRPIKRQSRHWLIPPGSPHHKAIQESVNKAVESVPKIVESVPKIVESVNETVKYCYGKPGTGYGMSLGTALGTSGGPAGQLTGALAGGIAGCALFP